MVVVVTTKRRVKTFTCEEIEALLIKAADLQGPNPEVEWTGSSPWDGATVTTVEVETVTEGEA